MTTTATSSRQHTRTRLPLPSLIVFAVATVWAVGVLWLTVPRSGGICPSILPAPAGCGLEARLPLAIAAAVLVLGLGALAVWTSHRLTDSRWRWLPVAGFTAIATVGYYAVLYAQ